jgi:hypothetical protein
MISGICVLFVDGLGPAGERLGKYPLLAKSRGKTVLGSPQPTRISWMDNLELEVERRANRQNDRNRRENGRGNRGRWAGI